MKQLFGSRERQEAPQTPVSEVAVMEALSTVQEPELGKDLVTLKMVEDLEVEAGRV